MARDRKTATGRLKKPEDDAMVDDTEVAIVSTTIFKSFDTFAALA